MKTVFFFLFSPKRGNQCSQGCLVKSSKISLRPFDFNILALSTISQDDAYGIFLLYFDVGKEPGLRIGGHSPGRPGQ